jgi:hypothetical protein
VIGDLVLAHDGCRFGCDPPLLAVGLDRTLGVTAPLTVMIFTLCARIGGEVLIVDVGLSDLLGDEAITLCIGLVVRGLVLVLGGILRLIACAGKKFSSPHLN